MNNADQEVKDKNIETSLSDLIQDNDWIPSDIDLVLFFDGMARSLPDDHWLGDILRVMYSHDLWSAERLHENYYRDYHLFDQGRQTRLDYWRTKRMKEQGVIGAGFDEYVSEWKRIVLTAMILVLGFNQNHPERSIKTLRSLARWIADETKPIQERHYGLNQSIRRLVRVEIEKDLTDGFSFDSSAMKDINPLDQKGGNKDEQTNDPEQVLDWMQEQMTDKYTQRNTENEIENFTIDYAASKLLGDMIFEDKLILLCPYGSLEDLARRLKRSPNSLSQRKRVLIEQLKNKASNTPQMFDGLDWLSIEGND